MNETTRANTAPVTGLDPARIGEILMRLPCSAAMLRHTSLKSSLGYAHSIRAGGDPELEFVRAILTEKLSVVHDEWYGGRFNASRMAADGMDGVLGALRARAEGGAH
jgi:hypothetical protein